MEFSELININSTSNKNISTIYDNIVSDIIFNIFQGIQILNITDNKIEKLLEQ